jgi:hypothetical protein
MGEVAGQPPEQGWTWWIWKSIRAVGSQTPGAFVSVET